MITILEHPDLAILRSSDKKAYVYQKDPNSDDTDAILILNTKLDSDLNSILSIIRTTFMLLLLCSSAIFFSKDSNELVLNPIERMLTKVKLIGKNPLEAARIAENEAVAEE